VSSDGRKESSAATHVSVANPVTGPAARGLSGDGVIDVRWAMDDRSLTDDAGVLDELVDGRPRAAGTQLGRRDAARRPPAGLAALNDLARTRRSC
jgi:hypothetical protein